MDKNLALLRRKDSEPASQDVLELLRSQDLMLRRITACLSTGPLAESLALQLGLNHRQFIMNLHMKWGDIDYLFDQLVSEKDLLPDGQDLLISSHELLQNPSKLTVIHFSKLAKGGDLKIHFSAEALEKADALLQSLDQSFQDLRAFMLEKFAFEDLF